MNLLTVPGGIRFYRRDEVLASLQPKEYNDAAATSQRRNTGLAAALDGRESSSPPPMSSVHTPTHTDLISTEHVHSGAAAALIHLEHRKDDVEVHDFDLYAALPRLDLWATLNMHDPRARAHAKRLVREFLVERQRDRQRKMRSMNVEVVREMESNRDLRAIIGASVNVVALASHAQPTCGPIDMDLLLHGNGNGPMVATRQRNSASRVCITPPTPTVQQSPVIEQLLAIQEQRTKNEQARNSRSRSRKRQTNASTVAAAAAVDDDDDDDLVSSNTKRGYNLFACTEMYSTRTLRIFERNKRLLLTGAQDPYTALYSMLQLTWMMACEGCDIPNLDEFSTQNVVSCFRLPETVDLEKMKRSRLCEQTQFLKRNFPAVIYPPDEKCIKEAHRRARRMKKLRKDIVTDTSWHSASRKRANACIQRSVRSYDAMLVKKEYARNAMGVQSKRKEDVPSQQEDCDVGNTLSRFLAPAAATSRRKRAEENVENIVYRSGAQVITGAPDQDIETELYQLNCEHISEVMATERLRKQKNKNRNARKKQRISSTPAAAATSNNNQVVSMHDRDTRLTVGEERAHARNMSRAIAQFGEQHANTVVNINSAYSQSNATLRREATVALGADKEDDVAPRIERPNVRALSHHNHRRRPSDAAPQRGALKHSSPTSCENNGSDGSVIAYDDRSQEYDTIESIEDLLDQFAE